MDYSFRRFSTMKLITSMMKLIICGCTNSHCTVVSIILPDLLGNTRVMEWNSSINALISWHWHLTLEFRKSGIFFALWTRFSIVFICLQEIYTGSAALNIHVFFYIVLSFFFLRFFGYLNILNGRLARTKCAWVIQFYCMVGSRNACTWNLW